MAPPHTRRSDRFRPGLPIASAVFALATACVLSGCATREPALLPLLPGGSSTVELSATLPSIPPRTTAPVPPPSQ